MRRSALRAIVLAAVVAGTWFTLRGISGSQLLHALARTDLPFVAAFGLPLLAVGSVLRTGRYRALLPALDTSPPFFDLWPCVILSMAGNNVLPLRAGELLRTRESVAAGYRLSRVAIAQLAVKVVEASTLAIYATPALAAHVGYRRPLLVITGLTVLGALVAGWTARRFQVEPRQLLTSLAWSLVADAVEIAIIAVCLKGLGLSAGLLPSVTVFAAVNLAVALPSTPGNVGAFEAGAALSLISIGVERDAAVAFAFVYRAVQWPPVTLAGAVLWTKRMVASPPARAGAS
jgi:uncharacterized membrane protein YbhN (UPF0104 family)